MSTVQTVEIDLTDHLADYDGDADTSAWTASIELNVRWFPAEPEIGIFESQGEVTSAIYEWQGEHFTDDAAFASAIYSSIGQDIEIGEDALLAILRKIEDEVELTDD